MTQVAAADPSVAGCPFGASLIRLFGLLFCPFGQTCPELVFAYRLISIVLFCLLLLPWSNLLSLFTRRQCPLWLPEEKKKNKAISRATTASGGFIYQIIDSFVPCCSAEFLSRRRVSGRKKIGESIPGRFPPRGDSGINLINIRLAGCRQPGDQDVPGIGGGTIESLMWTD